MRKRLTFIFCLFALYSKADNPIAGNSPVKPNATETYTVMWDSWNSDNDRFANVTWWVTHGTIISEDKHTVTIQWEDVPDGTNVAASIHVEEDLGGGSGDRVVDIETDHYNEFFPCTGVLGPAVIFEDFGTGTNFGPPLPAGVTGYGYYNSCGLVSGKYTITNSTANCRSVWLGLQDHTPNDVNGYMMMIDGDANQAVIYRKQVNNLTDAFRYEFTAYVANLSGPEFEKPRLRFELRNASDVVVASSDTYIITRKDSDPWVKMSFMFNIPQPPGPLYVVLVNQNNNASGNDYVVDDISFAPCYTPIIASFSNTDIIHKSYTCNNGSVTLYSRWPTPTIPINNPSYQWQRTSDGGTTWTDLAGANSISFAQVESSVGIFKYRIIAYETSYPTVRVISNEITFFVQQMIVDIGTNNVFNCNSSPVQLNSTYRLNYSDPVGPTYQYTFSWSPNTYLSNPNIANPTISLPGLPPNQNSTPPPPVVRNYTLTVANTTFAGCVASANQTVNQYNPRKVYVPSAFTPNGDGVNDLFRPINIDDYPGAKFWVWNRWGQNVFYSEGPTLQAFSWDGKYYGTPQQSGVFTWQVEIPGCPTNISNASTNGGTQPSGTVTLTR